MTEIKICGLKTLTEVALVNDLLPDYGGFVFAPGKRQVTPEQARGLVEALHPRIKAVGVFVNRPAEEVQGVARFCGLNTVQLHGEEGPEMCRSFDGLAVWKAFRLGHPQDVQEAAGYPGLQGYLLDAYTPHQQGGTGKVLPWAQIARAQQTGLPLPRPLILAGGLNPENVKKAMGLLQPDVVDVSSGVEEAGGKSREKIAAFIKQVRSEEYESTGSAND